MSGEKRAPGCPRCGDTGWILESIGGIKQARSCDCRAATIRRQKLEAAGIPERYAADTIDNFNDLGRPALQRAKQAAREFVDLYPVVDHGLLLVGPSGRGKTHLACAMLAELILRKGVSGLYADFSDLLLKIQSSFRPDADASKESLLTPYAEAELLVLDELGASKPHPWVLDVLYNLLNTRYNRRRITIATSNYEDEPDAASGERDRLEDRLNYRLRSRLYEMCQMIPLRGEDYRKQVLGAQTRTPF
ncbi:MAG TPA: ATP-binding protein [Thermoanaerobaculia bacterium]